MNNTVSHIDQLGGEETHAIDNVHRFDRIRNEVEHHSRSLFDDDDPPPRKVRVDADVTP